MSTIATPSLIGRRGSASRTSTILIGVAALAALVAIAEVGLRLYLGGAYLSPPIFARLDGKIGYGLTPSVSHLVHQSGRTVTMSTDAQGHRVTPGALSSVPLRLHLVGGSQVFGWGLSDNETVAAKLQQLLGADVAVINHGVPGYGAAEYVQILKSVPVGEPVVVVHTEENDGAKAYELIRQDTVSCTYIASFDQEGPIRCALMNSRLLQSASLLSSQWQDRYHLTPLGFSNYSRVAGRVLHARIAAHYNDQMARRQGSLLFTIVPWKGRYSSEWTLHYKPPPRGDVAQMPTPFPDSLEMVQRFASTEAPTSLYVADETHLSPAGAEMLAQALASAVKPLVP